ncbi:MAG: serine/threonine protein kinase [Phycisphaerae bacterium]|nr:serine/threonine protein kinase [Phycisphaerae bacterium]
MMDARQYNLVHAVFIGACDQPENERAGYIDAACAGDTEVRSAVLRMFERDRQELTAGDLDSQRPRLIELLAEPLLADGRGEVADAIPDQVGPYRVIRKVGQGGMGAVFEAEQDQPRRRVAVKMLRQGPGASTLLKRFRREIDLLGRLQHPGIAQIYNAGTMSTPSGNSPYFAMEFVDGLPLTKIAEELALPLPDRVRLMAQACDAVHFAHQQGIVHRDLKPQNMLVARPAPAGVRTERNPDEPLALKILDFGIARVLDDANRGGSIHTEMGQIIGTICYMSPEQLTGDNAAIDIRSDVYALGVVLYELLTGRLPHDLSDKTIPQAAKIVAFDPPTRLSRHRPELRGDLEAIVAKAIEKDKARRYASASELGADLRRYLRREPIMARPLTVRYQLSRFAQRNRGLVWAFGLATAFLLLGIVGTSVGLFRALDSEQRARASEAAARRESYRLALAAADATWKIAPLQARSALESAPEELRGWEWEHFASRMEMILAAYPSEGAPSIGIDARAGPIAALVRTGAVDIVEMESGRVRVACRSDAALTAPRLSRDGTRLAAMTEAGGKSYAAVFDTTTGERLRWLETVGTRCALSADGRTIAVVSPRQTIQFVDTDTGVVRAEAALDPQATLVELRLTPGGVVSAEYIPLPNGQQYATFYSAETGDRITPTSPVDRAYPLYDIRDDLVVGHAPDTPYLDMRAVEVWPASSPASVRLFKGHPARLKDAAISPDGAFIASSGTESTVRIWEIASGACQRVIGLLRPVDALRWSADGRTLVCVDSANRALLLATDQAESLVLAGHTSFVFHAVFSPDGARIASAGWNNEVRLWDARTGALLCQVHKPDGSLRSPSVLGFSPDGSTLVADAVAWDVPSLLRDPPSPDRAPVPGKKWEGVGWAHLAGNARKVTHVGGQFEALSRERSVVAALSERGLLRVADIDGNEMRTIQAGPGPRQAVTVGPGGRLAATAGSDKIIRIWDVATGRMVRALEPRPLHVYSMDFSPDGTRLVGAGEEGAILIWDTRHWELLTELRGHTQYVSAVSFSPDGNRIVSASGDGTVRVWDSEPRSVRRAPPPALDRRRE